MSKQEIIDKLTNVQIKLNDIALYNSFKKRIDKDLVYDLLRIADEIGEIRNELKTIYYINEKMNSI